MTIRMLQAWNGLHQQKIVTTLSGSDEAALVAAGIATYDLDGPSENLRMAQLVTDGGVNYLVDANGAPLRQTIQIASSFVPAVRSSVGDATDANFATLANITVPGGLMGPNGQLRIYFFVTFTTTGTKYLAIDVGGVNIGSPSYSGAQISGGLLTYFNNVGVENQNKTPNFGSSPFNASSNVVISSAVNTAQPFNVTARMKWGAAAGAAGADTFTIIGYTVEAVYAP